MSAAKRNDWVKVEYSLCSLSTTLSLSFSLSLYHSLSHFLSIYDLYLLFILSNIVTQSAFLWNSPLEILIVVFILAILHRARWRSFYHLLLLNLLWRCKFCAEMRSQTLRIRFGVDWQSEWAGEISRREGRREDGARNQLQCCGYWSEKEDFARSSSLVDSSHVVLTSSSCVICLQVSVIN